MIKKIETKLAPKAIGPYSQAIEVGKLVFISGQLPVDYATNNLTVDDIKQQTAMSLDNMQAILNEGKMKLNNVVKTTVYLKDMNDFKEMNEVYANYFSAPYPARVCIQVAALPMGALVEIEAIAEKVD